MKMWRAKNKEHRAAYLKEWKARNAEEVQSYNVAYLRDYAKQPRVKQARWERHLRENYQLTPEQFNALWVKQNGQCAICEIHLMPKGRKLDAVTIDHNHDTGEVRGLLCRSCNHGIGHLKDDPKVLRKAAEYLLTRGHYGTDP